METKQGFFKRLFRKNYKTELNGTSGTRVAQQLLPFAIAIKNQLAQATDAYSRYRLCDDVRSAVDVIAEGMMMIDLEVVDSKDQPIENHPLGVLLEFVNNSQPAKDFWREMFIDFLICGETFLLRKKKSGITVELEHIPCKRVEVEIGDSGLTEYIVTSANGNMTTYNEKQNLIIHIHTALLDKIRSSSPLESISSLIDASISSDLIASSMAKSGIYKTFFKVGYDTATQNEVITSVIADIAGIENAGGVLPVPSDVTLEIMEAKNGLESAFNETIDKLISSAVAKLYHIPTDFLTSTYTQGKYQQSEINISKFYENAVLPQIRLIVSFLNFTLAREYDGIKIIISTEDIPELSIYNTTNINDFDILSNKIDSRSAFRKVFSEEPDKDIIFKDEQGVQQ